MNSKMGKPEPPPYSPYATPHKQQYQMQQLQVNPHLHHHQQQQPRQQQQQPKHQTQQPQQQPQQHQQQQQRPPQQPKPKERRESRPNDAAAPQQQQQQQQRRRDRGNPGRFTILRRRRAMMAKRSEVGICTKYILFFENFILFLVGLALLAIGTYILVLKEKQVHDVLGFFLDPACDMCLGGALISMLAFLGCTGSLRENTCFLKAFYYGLSVFLFLELAAAVCFFLIYYVPDVKAALFPQDAFSQAIVHYRDDRDMQDLIDSLQRSLGCCGMSDSEMGYQDWNNNIYFNCSQANNSPEKCSVPPSCCKMHVGENVNLFCGGNIYKFQADGTRVPYDTSRIYTAGCLKALGDWVNENSLVLGGVLLGILLPQIFIICLSKNLMDMINAQKSRWNR